VSLGGPKPSGAAHLQGMSTQTTFAPAPYEVLADLPTGATFTAAGKRYTMGDGFEVQPAAHRGWFNVIDAAGRRVRVAVGARTPIVLDVERY
jgi:hypothetical protein